MTTDLWNTILPMLLLCGLVTGLPRILVPGATLSHRRLALGIALTAGLALLAGAVMLAFAYAAINPGTWQQALQAPLGHAGFFLGRASLFAMFWGPLLAFVWLVRAQELNHRAGLCMTDEGKTG